MLKKISALIVGGCIAVTAVSCVSPEPPENNITEEQGKKIMEELNTGIKHFTVDGTNILDPDGNIFLVKGVNVNGPGWVFPRDTLQDVALIADAWQFNTVRLCAAVGWHWAQGNNADLDGIIKAFTERNIVVMLELHDWTGIWPEERGYDIEGGVKWIPSIAELKAYWVDIAERFGHNPYVWFNIMNEPGSDNSRASAESWLSIHGEVIEAIRNTGAENIIVLDEHGWGQGSGYYGGAGSYDSAIIRMGTQLDAKYGNLVYSLHVYYAWRDGKSRFDAYFKDAHERGLCVIIGEFGVGKDDAGLHNAIKGMYNSAIPNNIGRIYWAWDDSFPLTYMGKGAGWTIDSSDGEKPGNLTWVGELIWADNRGLLTALVPDYDLMLLLLPNGDFEDGMTGWQDWGGASVQSGESYNGSNAMIIAAGATGGAGRSLDLKPGTAYVFSARGKGGGDVGVKYRDANTPEVETHVFVSFSGTEWEQKSVEFTLPDEFSGATLFIWKGGADIELYLDDLELSQG